MNKITKIILIIIALVVLIGLIVFAVVRYSKVDETANFIQYKDPHLTDEQKQPFLDRIREAEQKLSEVDKRNKDEIYKLQVKIASEYFPLGEYAKSRKYYLDAIKTNPDQSLPYYSVANVEYAMMDYESAMEHMDKALKIEPQNVDHWRFKIEIAKKLNYTKEQIFGIYDQALQTTHDHVDLYVHKALYLTEIGDLEGAVAQWKKAIEKDPDRKAFFEQEIIKLQNRLK